MTQYLVAVWDYTAEGEFELSFKQGDRIKLLEKHNDDWWEGELNEEIGFFPANRIRLETSQGPQSEPLTTEEPPTMPTSHQPMQPQAVETPIPSPPKVIYDSPLPQGWEHAYDEEGTIYYFNEFTGESRWERPADELEEEKEEEGEEDEEEEEERRGEIKRDESLESYAQSLQPDELKKLEFHQLKPDWIRHKGYVQMKMISEKEDGGKLSSWKVYYAVLSNGFLLLYKEAHAKSKKPSHTHVPVGSFDLESCKIDPAGKQDTKRKHVFIISTPKKVKLYIQTTSDKEFSAWLDAIMRELVKRKEGQNEDTEILRLLKSLTFDESQMKVNRKMTSTDDKKSKGHWFSSKPGKNGDIRKIEPRYVYGQTQPSGENDVFGGLLRMEENGDIPHIVTLCIKEVEARGLKSVGIYRLSGPASTIQKYRAAFNNKEAVSFKDEQDINTVTGLLKLYFRELRNPLMTHEYYDWFMEAARMNDYEERMYQIKSIIHSLPKPNYTVLEYLMRHLNLVASYSEINKMESSNLALIFSVGLLRSPLEDLSSIMQSDLQSKIIEAIIQQVDWFFEEEEENVEDV